MRCFAGPFGNDRQSVGFSVESQLNIKTIEAIFGKKYDSIDLIVRSKANILDANIVSNSVVISTNFAFKRLSHKKEWIDLWIIIASIAAGVVLLVAIVFVLWKLGFFMRNQYLNNEEHNNSKSETDHKESGSLLDFSLDSGAENDVQESHEHS